MVRMLMKELKELLDFLPKYVYDELHSLLIRKLSDSDFVLAYWSKNEAKSVKKLNWNLQEWFSQGQLGEENVSIQEKQAVPY